jgi:hypothetical protein
MAEQTIWVLRRRYIELGVNLRAAWDTYIRFYTVFLTFSMAALAWVFAYSKETPAVRMIAWVFTAQTIMTAATSMLIARHSYNVRRSQERIEKLLLAAANTPMPAAPAPISIPMAIWAGGANCLAMTAMAVIWVYVASR